MDDGFVFSIFRRTAGRSIRNTPHPPVHGFGSMPNRRRVTNAGGCCRPYDGVAGVSVSMAIVAFVAFVTTFHESAPRKGIFSGSHRSHRSFHSPSSLLNTQYPILPLPATISPMTSKATRKQIIEQTMRRINGRVTNLSETAERWSWIRLGLFVGGIIATGAAYFALGAVAMWVVLGLFAVGFWLSVAIHQHLEGRITRYQTWVNWQEQQLARMELIWGILKPVEFQIPPTHPYAHDLNIVGDASLLRLLDTTITTEGRARLATWLTTTAPNLAETQTRQSIVQEIAPRHRLRMKIAVEATLNKGARGWTTTQLQEALQPSAAESTLWVWAIGAGLFAWLNLALIGLNVAGQLPPYWYGTLPLYGILLFAGQRVVGDMFNDALTLESALRPLNAVFTLLERWHYQRTPALAELATPFRDSTVRPSHIVARVMQVVNLTGVRGNPMMWLLLNFVLPYDFLVAIRFNRVRQGLSALLPDWLERWFTLEAVAALGNLGYLNPHYTYPVVQDVGRRTQDTESGKPKAESGLHDSESLLISPVPLGRGTQKAENDNGLRQEHKEHEGSTKFTKNGVDSETTVSRFTFPLSPFPLEGRALGHPLIRDGEKVTNDFRIEALGTVAMITGSNMSGKSSFLRTLGVNLALAYAGGPVDAQALSVIPMRLFACMSVNDSVTDGISFFYAEVKRLKALLEALNQPHDTPLFFLIDEIFRGTNNRERLIGARSYTRALVGKDGAGLISTHDLELTHLAEESAAILNYHFRETVADGRMHFDYTLRPGPCPTTNALKIMALEGLPVEAGIEETAKSVHSA